MGERERKLKLAKAKLKLQGLRKVEAPQAQPEEPGLGLTGSWFFPEEASH